MSSSNDAPSKTSQPAFASKHPANWVSYRNWWITYDPPPIPVRTCDWQFWHDDYDGAPDAGDSRCGHAPSLEAAKAEVDFMESDNG